MSNRRAATGPGRRVTADADGGECSQPAVLEVVGADWAAAKTFVLPPRGLEREPFAPVIKWADTEALR